MKQFAIIALLSLSASLSFGTILYQQTFDTDGTLTNEYGWNDLSGDFGLDVSGGSVTLGSASLDAEIEFAEQSGEVYFGFDLTVLDAGSSMDYAFGLTDGGFAYNNGRFYMDGQGDDFIMGLSMDSSPGASTNATPTVLQTGMTYRIVGYFDHVDTARLWINPNNTDFDNYEVQVTDIPSATNTDGFFMRQGGGWDNGAASWQVDNLTVSTTFTEAVPEPASMSLFALASGIVIFIRRRMKNR